MYSSKYGFSCSWALLVLVLRELAIMGVGVILSVLHSHVSVRDALNKELSLDNLAFESLMAISPDWAPQ